jgi:hypothetical protein
MKTQWKKWTAIAVIVGAAPASAIPVTFDFSGTVVNVVNTDFATSTPVFDLSTAGQAFTAQFIIDTDLFGPGTASSNDTTDRLFYNSELPDAITASFMLNGEAIDVTPFNRNRATVSFLDSKGVVSCGVNCSRIAPDQFNVNLGSDDFTPEGPAGQRVLSFSFVADFQGFENPESAMSWFTLTPDFDINQLGTLSLPDAVRPNVILSDYTLGCTEGQCTPTSSRRTQFAVTSATRSVTVPEPETFGMLVMGLAGAMFMRRRRRQNA